jgi:hypothetical protein
MLRSGRPDDLHGMFFALYASSPRLGNRMEGPMTIFIAILLLLIVVILLKIKEALTNIYALVLQLNAKANIVYELERR